MPRLALCSGDPLVDTLRDVFGANIVRVPETRVRPLAVVASDGRRASFRTTSIRNLLEGAPDLAVEPAASGMASLTGRRSRSIELGLGLRILDGFLRGFGIPSAGIEASLSGATEVAFSFGDVVRSYVDIGALGAALAGKRVDRVNPAAAIFFADDEERAHAFLVIDSTIASSEFTLSVERAGEAAFRVDLPTIQQVVERADAGVEVRSESGREITFSGDRRLAFAFSCVRLDLDPASGRIASMPPAGDVPALERALGRDAAGEADASAPARGRVLFGAPAMFEWDDEAVEAES